MVDKVGWAFSLACFVLTGMWRLWLRVVEREGSRKLRSLPLMPASHLTPQARSFARTACVFVKTTCVALETKLPNYLHPRTCGTTD